MDTNKSQELHTIFRARAIQEPGCITCGSDVLNTYYQKRDKKKYICSNCLTNVSVMAGTQLKGTQVPVEKWFSILEDVLTTSGGIDSKHVETKYKLSNTTSWNMLYSIRDWINSSATAGKAQFLKVEKKFKTKYVLVYNNEIPPKQLEAKMINMFPPLFEHLRERRLAA